MVSVADLPNYEEKIANEKRFFDVDKYDPSTLIEQVPDALNYSHDAFHAKVQRALGKGTWEYIIAEVNARPGAKVLSIGSGACGLEIILAKSFTVPFDLTCLDLNETLLELGKNKGAEEGIEIEIMAQDANRLKLEQTYDVIVAHASLHHFIEFEHIFSEINRHLAPSGVFIAYEPVPRNGMLLWPQTKSLINRLFE